MVSETHGGSQGVMISAIPSWAGEPEPTKSHWRPPVYNPEDYALGLMSRKCGAAPPVAPKQDEMTLRQFSSTADLLTKLSNDLRQAYPSFVQEFVGSELDGVTALLELLKAVQGTSSGGGGESRRRQSMLEELACLQCLSHCLRCSETPKRLAASTTGLFALAASIMSNLNKSRVLALQILRKTCEDSGGKGFGPVSDAMSTMRLRFGEPVRFRFLCGMLSSASPDLLVAGLAFINSFVEAAPSPQTQLYIQAELDQAGFKPLSVAKTIPNKLMTQSLQFELIKWQKLYVDVGKVKLREGELIKEVHMLTDKIKYLEKRLQILQEEKSLASSNESRLKSRCDELEREVSSLRGIPNQGGSTPAEDEGISSSGQDDGIEREPLIYEMYAINNNKIIIDAKEKDDEETTIDEVIEELQNIINDAETDYNSKKDKTDKRGKEQFVTKYSRYRQRSSHDLAIMKVPEDEAEIVPVKLVPHPPRRSRSLYLEREYANNHFFFEDEDSQLNTLSIDTENTQSAQYCSQIAHLTYVKRRETFHNGLNDANRPGKPDYGRRGSLDGVSYIMDDKSTKIYIDGTDERKKSKSLDRLGDGLDSMVDIVVTPTPVPRTIMNELEVKKPVKKADEALRYSDRTVFLPIKNEPTSQTFILKRGFTNAGLYSGDIRRDSISVDYYSKGLNGLNLSITGGKLTDLPSGLY